MKKFFSRITILLLAFMLLFGLIACTGTGETTDNAATINGIEIDSTTIPTNAVASSLDLSTIKVKIYWSDENETSIDLTYDMVSINDRAKLDKVGLQQIKISYEECSTEFQIYLNEKILSKYTLTVEGGVPTAINNITLTEIPTLTNGVYTAQYDSGTIVSVTWVSVEGYVFSHWTDNDITQDTDSTTIIAMTQNHNYKAISSAMVSVVNFHTNGATASTIAPKRTNLLYESDINNGNVLLREDYVFDGWTITAVGSGTEINSTATKITFPYNIEVETNLFATWRPLGITYRQKEGEVGYIVTDYDLPYLTDLLNAPTSLDIPSLYQGYNVTGIDADAFTSDVASMLQSIYIPKTITEIEDGAFRNCTQLKTITVDSTSTKYESLDGVLYGYGLEKLIAYPSAKIAVEYNVQSSATEIASYAFKDALLGSVVVGSNVVTIGNSAFNSTHFDRIDLSSVVVNGSSVFGNDLFDSNLRKILVSNSYLSWYKGVTSLAAFASVQTQITTERSDLTDVELGINTAKTILYRIVTSVNSVNPQASIEVIGAARNLTTITILPKLNGRNIFSIGVKAFNYCKYLSTIIIPSDSNLERVGKDAFTDTPWLAKTITNNCIIQNDILFKYLGSSASFTLPRGIKKIAEGAFINNDKLTTINMSENSELTFIGSYAFYNCAKLSGNLEFMSNVVTIYNYAFASTAIQNILLSDSSDLTTIGENAFANCYYLKSVELGAKTSSIDATSFIYCYALESFDIQINAGITAAYKQYDGILYKCNSLGIANELFCYPSGKMLPIFDINEPILGTPLNISIIGDYSLFFSNIAALQVPSSIVSISTKAVYIPGLTYVEFEEPLSNITYNVMFVTDPLFIGKYEPEYVIFNIADKTTNIPTTTEDTNIDNFYGHNATLKTNLNHYNAAHTTFTQVNSLICALEDGEAFASVVRSSRTLAELTIPDTCRTIGDYSFFGYYLNKVSSVGDIYDINNYGFYKATNLKILDLQQSTSTPTIMSNTFNSSFNNGLLIYIHANYTENYVEDWEALSKYLLEGGIGIANFVTRANEEWNSINYYDSTSWKTMTSDSYTEQGTISANYFPTPIRKGYLFNGWLDDKGVIINSANNYVIPYNIDLTASWTAKNYTVIFKVGAGVTMETKQISISYDDTFNYDTPTYPNKNFLYWKDSAGKTYGQSTDETYRIWKTHLSSSTLVLYPVWEDILYRIIYDSASLVDATCDTNPVNVKFADDYTLAVPTKNGFIFQGWTLEAIVNGVIPVLITDEYGVSLDFWSLNNILQFTVYPYFIAESHITVTLIIGKDELNQDIQYDIVSNVVFGQNFTFAYLEDNILDSNVKALYPQKLFCGWIDDLGVKYTDDDGAGLYNWNVASDTTLYALWPTTITTQGAFDAWLLSTDYLSESIALGCDITITDPIGDRNNPYTGVFIGNGYTVTLNYDVADINSTNYDAYVGMVAYNKGTIKNVKLDANINILNTSSYNNDLYLGGVAGVNEGKITSTNIDSVTEINVSIFVNFTSTGKYAYIGGLAGRSTGIINNISCEINTITIQVSGVVYNGSNATNVITGSIVGNVAGGNVNTRSAKYYYNDGAFILNDFGSVAPTATTTVNVTRTKNS